MSLSCKVPTIDRRALWKSSLFGALLATRCQPSSASAVQRSLGSVASHSILLTARLAREVARVFFGFSLPTEDLERIAHSANGTLGAWRTIAALDLAPIDPPFSYPALLAEAEQLTDEGAK